MTNPFGTNEGVNEGVNNTVPEEQTEINSDNQKTELNPEAEVVVNEDISDEEIVEQPEEESHNSDLEKLQAEYDKLNNQYIRLAADFDNYRKRQAQERESLLKYGAEDTLKKLIDVLDNFDRGEKAIADIEDCEKVKESFSLVHKQLTDSLTKIGLEVIQCIGEEFDPNFHEAVMQTPTNEHPEHTIIAELQKGYKLGDRVLRPALVNVATAE